MKKATVLLYATLMGVVLCLQPVTSAYAAKDLDSVESTDDNSSQYTQDSNSSSKQNKNSQSTQSNGNSQSTQGNDSQSTQGGNSKSQGDDYNSKGVQDYYKTQKNVTGENMEKAGVIASPIVNIFGNIIGFLLMISGAGIFVITAIDLCYIGIPPIRGLLYKGGAQGGMGMGMGMGGMGMATQQQGRKPLQLISDEAVQVVGGSQQGGASMGMSGMGGMGMSGMGMSGMGQQQQPAKLLILEYFKKRAFFTILFIFSSIVLTSSLFTDCGINVAQLFMNLVTQLMNAVNGIG